MRDRAIRVVLLGALAVGCSDGSMSDAPAGMSPNEGGGGGAPSQGGQGGGTSTGGGGGTSPAGGGGGTSSAGAGAGPPSGNGGGGTSAGAAGKAPRGAGGGNAGGPPAALADVCGEVLSAVPESAFPVTPADKANLEKLLAAHPVLSLAPGDYRTGGPAAVHLSSDQWIVALPGAAFPDVVVAAGTTRARLRGLHLGSLSFEAGATSSYNCFTHLTGVTVDIKNASVAHNLFLALAEARLDVDTTGGGIFRDNRFVKFNAHGLGLAISIKGDPTRKSGGNSFLMVDAQTPQGSVYAIDGQSEVDFFSVNAEAYNWEGQTNAPTLFKVANTGVFRAAHITANQADAHKVPYPALDIDADTVIVHDIAAQTDLPQLRLGPTNKRLFSWQNGWTAATIDDKASAAGPRMFAAERLAIDDVAVRLGATEVTSEVTGADGAGLRDLLAPAKGSTPWALPTLPPIPDPTGPLWETGLGAHPDEAASLQALVDTQGIVFLEPRVYYVSAPIVLHAGQGLVGVRNGKTALVALSKAADLIHIELGNPNGCAATTGGFTLANLTLQGGANGIHSNYPGVQVNQAVISHVTFRNMSGAGILLDGAYGWDNNVFDYVNFVDCGYGFREEGQKKPASSCYGIGEWSTMAYMDKTVFYRSQFLRCGHAFVMNPSRASGGDALIESAIEDSGVSAVELGNGANNITFALTTFVNNMGNPTVRGPAAIVGSTFSAGVGESMLGPGGDDPPGVDLEGCTFARGASKTATIFGNVAPTDWRHPHWFSISNSTSKDMPLGAVDTSFPVAGMYFNNAMAPGDTFAAFMTALEYRTMTTPDMSDDSRSVYTILSGAPNPGSHYLSGEVWAP